jgi:hypothetical protein
MEPRSGWLERSLERVNKNIQERPERLKPEVYRTKKPVAIQVNKKSAAA